MRWLTVTTDPHSPRTSRGRHDSPPGTRQQEAKSPADARLRRCTALRRYKLNHFYNKNTHLRRGAALN